MFEIPDIDDPDVPEAFDVPDVFDVPGVYPEMLYLCYVIYLIIFNYQLTSLYVLYMLC